MKKLIVCMLCISLTSCAGAFSTSDTQCKRNPKVDGLGVAAITGVPFAFVSTTPIGLSVAAIMGGSYYVTHAAACR
jgi:hypothetical protein